MTSEQQNALVASYFQAKAAATVSPLTMIGWQKAGRNDFVLIDVRLRGPQLTSRIPGALSVPVNEIDKKISELPKDKIIVLYCWDTWCSLAMTAALVLINEGFRVKELYGGIAAWKTLHLPEEALSTAETDKLHCSC